MKIHLVSMFEKNLSIIDVRGFPARNYFTHRSILYSINSTIPPSIIIGISSSGSSLVLVVHVIVVE